MHTKFESWLAAVIIVCDCHVTNTICKSVSTCKVKNHILLLNDRGYHPAYIIFFSDLSYHFRFKSSFCSSSGKPALSSSCWCSCSRIKLYDFVKMYYIVYVGASPRLLSNTCCGVAQHHWHGRVGCAASKPTGQGWSAEPSSQDKLLNKTDRAE